MANETTNTKANEANTKAEETKTEEKKKEPVRIDVVSNLPFDANIKSCFMNTIELSKVVDSLFASSMRDYVGCKISLNTGSQEIPQNEIPYGRLYVSLYFKDCSSTKDVFPINNVTNRRFKKTESKFDSLMLMSGYSAGRIYDVTPETYEALDEFRFFNYRRANWNQLTTEIVSSFGFSGTYNEEIVCCITGLDLEKIINKVYGTRTEEGIFQYQVTPVQIVANVNGEYVVQITQLDMRKLDDLRKSLGGPVARNEFHQYIR